MTLQDFILELNKTAFKLEDLSEELQEEAEDYISIFFPNKKESISKSNDLILQFIDEYDSAFNLISHISFNNEVIEDDNYIHFGWSREDLLVIDKASGEIIAIDYAVYGRKTFVCAASSEQFMKAFLIGGIHSIDKEFKSDNERIEYLVKKAKFAADIAGGAEYLRYWNSLNDTNIFFDEFGNQIPEPPSNSRNLLN
ncbi:hypothetical protein PDL71_10600 [Lacibacter sp. MH-610]|uniref:hypothetical protein n=1 Tax=Lacibacter sp. MH-610 TaxID=3020883 RepID=UPI003892C104